MSTFYFSTSFISRGKGQSAIAAAAYRSGESLYSELDMETKFYGKRTVEPDNFIIAPDNAPEWVYDRKKLWNQVEYHESKSNSRLAREIKLALPIELSNSVQRELLEEYVKENFVSRGMVADVAIHRDVEHNPHAHIMLTVRPFNQDGSWGSKQKREYIKGQNGNIILNDNGKKKFKKIELTDWDYKDTLIEWRRNLADKINDYYKKHEINEVVSHESYEKQGLNKIPKYRLTKAEYQMEKREREKADIKGAPYLPRTTFAKLNYEIEKANIDLEEFNKKINYLKQQRYAAKLSLTEQMSSIRKKYPFSNDDLKSIKIVAKRVKGYVDFRSAKENLSSLKHWKLKLDRERYSLIAYGKTMEKARAIFNKDPKKVMMYGFTPSSFKEIYNDRVNEFEKRLEKYNENVKAYKDTFRHSVRVYEIQKTFTNEEFKLLYPDYEGNIGDNDFAVELKFQNVEEFKRDGSLKNEIPELNHKRNPYNDQYQSVEKLLSEWKSANESLVILEKIKSKLKNEYAKQYKEWDAEKVFAKSVQYTETREQISEKENYKVALSRNLDKQIKILYPEVSKDTLEKLPPNIKPKILELSLTGEYTGKLSNDLNLVQSNIMKPIYTKQGAIEDSSNTNGISSSGSLLSCLINSAKQDEGIYDDLEKKRQRDKKRRHMKLHKEIGENEL